MPVPTCEGELVVTISVGAAIMGEGDSDLAAILNRADGALYEAKRAGRNRVATAPEPVGAHRGRSGLRVSGRSWRSLAATAS